MKLAYVTDFDLSSVLDGTAPASMFGFRARCYYTAKSLKDDLTTVHCIGPLTRRNNTLLSKIKQRFYYRLYSKIYFPWAEPVYNKEYAIQIFNKLSKLDSDIVICSEATGASYLNCKQPVVLWLDTLYVGLINFYFGDYSNLCKESIRALTNLDKLALANSKLCIFSSEWAAKTAIETYQVDPAKIQVIPSGANIECNRTIDDIKAIVAARPSNKCKLLFFGIDWERKGGDLVLEVAKRLNETGLNVELTIVGCYPPTNSSLPDFVISLGFINKFTPEGLSKINRSIAETHFLVVPSRAETYGNVFCEANSFGVPCISTKVGGIPTIIKDNLNGKVFSIDAGIDEYCTYIYDLFSDYSQYQQLAFSAFNEYQTRLNWSAAGQTAKKLFKELL
jgi:glycosyltransferase involved in cell wall biosynthesis